MAAATATVNTNTVPLIQFPSFSSPKLQVPVELLASVTKTLPPHKCGHLNDHRYYIVWMREGGGGGGGGKMCVTAISSKPNT